MKGKKKPKHRNRPGRKRAMTRSKGLKRVPIARRPISTNLPRAWGPLHARWKAIVLAPNQCVVCRRFRDQVVLDPHHVVSQQALKRYGRSLRLLAAEEEALLGRLLFDPRNGLCVCRDCHEAHETAVRRIPRLLVSESAWEFAREIGLDYLIERYYPEVA